MSTKVKDPKIILTECLLASISEVIASVAAQEIEQENFMEFGCYLHRTSPAIMELQMTQNVAPNVIEILQSLSTDVDLAKDLLGKCSTRTEPIMDSELKSIIKQLENVIRSIGQGLSSIPSSTFESHRYADIAIRSLSREMKNACFHIAGSQLCDIDEPKLDISSAEERENREVKNSVENSKELCKASFNSRSSEMPRLVDFLKGMYYGAHENGSQSFTTLPQLAEYIEPLYETFFCPLTKKIMDDPVTIGSGVTYERKAIVEWFKKFKDDSENMICPVTGQKLQSRILNTNIALKTTITEWIERNEATRIRVAHTALSLASSKAMILDAISDLQHLGRKRKNKVQMHNIGITKLLTRFLEHEDRKVRCETLNILRLSAEDDNGKDIIANTRAIAATVKMLSSSHDSERYSSVSFLLELSKSELLCESIGSIAGGILMLITMKYNGETDPLAAEKAEETLKNLEKCPKNIKCMGENGLLEPLLSHLIEGPEEIQMEMVNYLGELVLGDDMKTYVTERASLALVRMVHSGNSLTRKAALKALVQMSSHNPNGKLLADAGVVPIMVEEIFTRKIHNEPMDSKEEASTILANILESGIDPDSLQVNKHGHTVASDYFIYNIAHMLKYSVPDEVNTNLIKILLCLRKLPKPFNTVVSVIKETKVYCTIIEFLNCPQDELVITAARLLIALSSNMGHTIAEGLCKTRGQPDGLIEKLLESGRITKKQAISVNLLAKIPHQNLTLNLALLHNGEVPTILSNLREVQRGEMRAGRHTKPYLEGLVGILVRFTTTLYDQDILQVAREQNLTLVFTDLLTRTGGSDEVQRLAALGLERLSSESVTLSRPPPTTITESRRPRRSMSLILQRCFGVGAAPRGTKAKLKLCLVHRGECSASTTFCLLDSRAVERLLGCLEHENAGVVEAALSAICTLLDERGDVERSVEVLGKADAVRQVLRALREHGDEGVRRKCLWVIDEFLARGGESSASDISSDRLLPAALVSAYHHGESSTRRIAESILRRLDRMPHFSMNLVL